MAIDKEKITKILSEGAEKMQKAASDTKDGVMARYRAIKLSDELEELYIALGKLVNEAYNQPGSIGEDEVAALNEQINQKAQEAAAARAASAQTAGKAICSSCGRTIKSTYEFCPFCGANSNVCENGK